MSIEENRKKRESIEKNQVPEHLKNIKFVDDLLPEGESRVVGYIPCYGI